MNKAVGSSGVSSWAARVVLIIVALWVLVTVRYLVGIHPIEYYETEWLINYSAGFLRRGLPGELLLALCRATNIAPAAAVLGLKLSLFAAFLAVLLSLAWQRREWLGLAGAAFLLSNPLVRYYAGEGLGEKDTLAILLTMWHLWASSRPEIYLRRAFWPLAVGGLVLGLTHEGVTLFFWLPANAFITWRAVGKRAGSLALYAPAVLAVAVSVLFHGTQAQGEAMQRAWVQQGAEIGPPGSSAMAYGIGLSIPESMNLIRTITSVNSIGLFLCVSVPSALMLYVLLRLNGGGWARWALGIAAFSVPLWIIGCDWNRWIALPATLTAVIYLWMAPGSINRLAVPRFWWIGAAFGLVVSVGSINPMDRDYPLRRLAKTYLNGPAVVILRKVLHRERH